MSAPSSGKLNVLMIGTGEYTTGYVHGSTAASDKRAGIVALVMTDLRRRGKVDKLGLVGVSGKKMPFIRDHLQRNISGVYKDIDVNMNTYPEDHVDADPLAYRAAIDQMNPGDGVTIFTPDDTHFAIAEYAIERGLHVLVTKPPVKTAADHLTLIQLARRKKVLVNIEVHKRWDQIYADAREKIKTLGDFSYFNSYMSQPKHQLKTFRAWAGKSSDISYYLNSHHVDYLCWALDGIARPVKVTAMASTGVATAEPWNCTDGTEDTITLMVQWQNLSGSLGTSVHTASWVASSKAEVHSQQRFFYMGHKGEIRIDQAHRGFEMAVDETGYSSVNPLFMKYTPDSKGYFAGQRAYGYLSFEAWVDACLEINAGKADVADFERVLPTIGSTYISTAILEAGRKSLDQGGASVIVEDLEDTKKRKLGALSS